MQEANQQNLEFLSTADTHTNKKRKMSERVVVAVEVEENVRKRHRNEGPPSDCWSWRKYGQKPIKGSPYPRNNLLQTPGVHSVGQSSLLKSEENDFYDDLEELPTSYFFTAFMNNSFSEERIAVNQP